VSAPNNSWTFNADTANTHLATFSGDRGTVDVWKEPTGGSALRVRNLDGTQVSIARDSQGRVTYVEDATGVRLWVNEFLDLSTVEVTVLTADGRSWRGPVTVPVESASFSPTSTNAGPQVVTEADLRFVRELIAVVCDSRLVTALSAMLVGACVVALLPTTATPAAPALLTCAIPAIVEAAREHLICVGAKAAINFIDTHSVTQPILSAPTPRVLPPTVPLSAGQYDGSWRGSGRGTSNFGTPSQVQISFDISGNQIQVVRFPWRIDTPPACTLWCAMPTCARHTSRPTAFSR